MHWRITAWELFATVIFLVLEFYFLWSSSHVFTWIMATITVAGSLFLAFPIPIGLTLATIAMAVGLGTVEFLPPMRPTEVEQTGSLQPEDDPMPPNACERYGGVLPDSIFVIAGGATVTSNAAQFVPFSVDGFPILHLKRQNNEVYIDADVIDDGNLVARIKNNEFHVLSGGNTYVERRGDLSTLVVYRNRTELLYIRFLNPKAIRIRGLFSAPGKSPKAITDDMIGPLHVQDVCLTNVGNDATGWNF